MSGALAQATVAVGADGFTQIVVAIFGAMLGSFLNVLIHRLPPDREEGRVSGRRSACPSCGAPIPGWLNVPILAWLLLRGRAHCCGKPISARYPIVEALTALLIWALVRFPPRGAAPSLIEPEAFAWLTFGLCAYLLATLVTGTFIDLEFRMLYDKLTFPLIGVGVVGAMLVPEIVGDLPGLERVSPGARGLMAAMLGALTGGGVSWLVRVLGQWVFKQEALGLGDVKLMLGIGAFLGWSGALLTFFLGCLTGAVFGLLRRLFVNDPALAFGPYLALGAVLSLFFGQEFVAFLFETWPEWLAENRAASRWIFGGLMLAALFTLRMMRAARRRYAEEDADSGVM